MLIMFKRTPSIIRPFADIGTLLYRWILLLPFWPFTRFAKSEIVECFPMYFESKEDFLNQWKSEKVQVGAVWDAHWYKESRKGSDGKSLVVLTPEGPWYIDGRSSNCTRKDDNEHRCWVRHGSPEAGNLQVDKLGNTCESGAGSIRMVDRKNQKSLYHARLMKNNLIRIVFF